MLDIVCSNGFVTDRSNDPQLSYKIMSKSNGIDSLITEVESETKLLTMNARTKYEGINSAIDRQIEALETCIKELDEIATNGGTDKDQAIYFENFVSRNARYFIDSTE